MIPINKKKWKESWGILRTFKLISKYLFGIAKDSKYVIRKRKIKDKRTK